MAESEGRNTTVVGVPSSEYAKIKEPADRQEITVSGWGKPAPARSAGNYEKAVSQIPVPEQAIGPLTGIARRLDFLGPKIEAIEARQGKLEYAISKLELPGEGAMPELRMEQITFVATLEKAGTAGSRVMMNEYAPFSGYIKRVSQYWPDGTNHIVDIRVGHSSKQFCPSEGYLALNDVTPVYPFNEWVDGGEKIWVEMLNGDSANTHDITVEIILQGAAE